jgi:hypothetical protein
MQNSAFVTLFPSDRFRDELRKNLTLHRNALSVLYFSLMGIHFTPVTTIGCGFALLSPSHCLNIL